MIDTILNAVEATTLVAFFFAWLLRNRRNASLPITDYRLPAEQPEPGKSPAPTAAPTVVDDGEQKRQKEITPIPENPAWERYE